MWVKDLSNEEYRSRVELSSSDLKDILKSPFTFKSRVFKEPTPAMEFGTKMHSIILEKKPYLVLPDLDMRTIKAKEYVAHIPQGTILFKHQEKEKVETILGNLEKSALAKDILNHCHSFEISGFHDGKKIRPDALGDTLIADIKTTQSAIPTEFKWSVKNFHYHLSAAYYLDVAKQIDGRDRDFIIIAIENQAPYGIVVFKLSQSLLEQGRDLYHRALLSHASCSILDEWPHFEGVNLLND